MRTRKLSDTKIKICIVPKRVRWPERDTTTAWAKAHNCVDALQDFARDVDVSCVEAEQNADLSASAIARRRAELGDQTLSKLVNFRARLLDMSGKYAPSHCLSWISHADRD